MNLPKIVPHRFYRTPEGRTFSFFTSWKPDNAVLVEEGFTTENPDGTSGTGNKPFATMEEGFEWLERYQKRTGKPFQGMSAFTM